MGSTVACIGCGSDPDSTEPPVRGSATTTPPVADAPSGSPVPLDGDDIDGEDIDGEDTESDVGHGYGIADLGSVADVRAAVEGSAGFLYRPEIRAWVVRIPDASVPTVEETYGGLADAGMAAGFVALHQKCTHLGCRVPECVPSGRFECPCHGAVFNHIGEWVNGPAPRGLDRYAVSVVGGRVLIDASTTIAGSARGVLTVPGDVPEGGSACLPDS